LFLFFVNYTFSHISLGYGLVPLPITDFFLKVKAITNYYGLGATTVMVVEGYDLNDEVL